MLYRICRNFEGYKCGKHFKSVSVYTLIGLMYLLIQGGRIEVSVLYFIPEYVYFVSIVRIHQVYELTAYKEVT